MIKRLKWNVLYGSDNEVNKDGDLASSGSDEDFEQAARTLAELAKNDPRLRINGEDGSDSDGNEFVRNEFSEDDDASSHSADDDMPSTDSRQKLPSARTAPEDVLGGMEEGPADEPEFVEWKECNLCPGKRFLHDAEVESHLLSKAHKRALRRYERLQAQMQPDAEMQAQEADPSAITEEQAAAETERVKSRRKKRLLAVSAASAPSKSASNEKESGDDAAMDAEDEDAAERKKQAAKRKLKKLKERKWKLAQARLKNGPSPAEEAAREQADKLRIQRNSPEKDSQATGSRRNAGSANGQAKELASSKGKRKGKNAPGSNAKAMNSAVGNGNAANERKGPKVKSKKPMSAEKAARKARKRELDGNAASDGNAAGGGMKRANSQGRNRGAKKAKRSLD